jgi:hypothetical protein
LDGTGYNSCGIQYPEVGYWILRRDARILNPGIADGYFFQFDFLSPKVTGFFSFCGLPLTDPVITL